MEEMTEDTRVGAEARIAILFALGELAERKGEYNNAFAIFEKANQARQRRMKAFDQIFDPTAINHLEQAIKNNYTRMSSSSHSVNNTQQPVFVLGMPRSGTTLIAQIIASHPNAESRGELAAISRCFPDFSDSIETCANVDWAAKILTEFDSEYGIDFFEDMAIKIQDDF